MTTERSTVDRTMDELADMLNQPSPPGVVVADAEIVGGDTVRITYDYDPERFDPDEGW